MLTKIAWRNLENQVEKLEERFVPGVLNEVLYKKYTSHYQEEVAKIKQK